MEKEERKEKESTLEKIFRTLRVSCMMLILLVIAFVVLLFIRPKFFWQPFANFLNDGQSIRLDTEMTIEEAKAVLEFQLDINEDSTELIITEEILNTVARSEVDQLPFLTFEFNKDYIDAFWQINEKDDVVLLGYAKLVEETSDKADTFTDLKIDNLGLPRITIPSIFQKALFKSAKQVFDITGEETEGQSLIFNLLGTSSIYEIEDITIEEDRLIVLLDTDNSLYD